LDFNWLDITGLLAGICTTVAVIPQIRKAWETKSIGDVSPRMFMILMAGVGLWTIYGIGKSDWAIIITNGISFCLNGILLYILVRYKYLNKEEN